MIWSGDLYFLVYTWMKVSFHCTNFSLLMPLTEALVRDVYIESIWSYRYYCGKICLFVLVIFSFRSHFVLFICWKFTCWCTSLVNYSICMDELRLCTHEVPLSGTISLTSCQGRFLCWHLWIYLYNCNIPGKSATWAVHGSGMPLTFPKRLCTAPGQHSGSWWCLLAALA